MHLSSKQNQLLQELDKYTEDNKQYDDEYMKRMSALNIPKILAPCNQPVLLNYDDYLGSCKMKRATIFENCFNLEPFKVAIEEVSNNEIILYRGYLENILENGLHALIEIQFLDTLVILRKDTCNEKLVFNHEMKNIMFLMKNLLKFFDLNNPTVANEIFEKEKLQATQDYNIDIRYKSPEDLEQIVMEIKLKSLSLALAKQHSCLIDNTATIKSNYL